MPVSSETSISGPYTPNGVTTSFAFDFKAASASEVVATDGDGNVISTALYSVTLDDDEGGTLTFGTAPEASDYSEIYVLSEPELTQPSDFDNAGPSFNPAALTRAIDRAAIRDLKLNRDIGRALKLPFGEVPITFPGVADRANKYLSFLPDGSLLMSSGTGADSGLREDIASSTGGAMVGTTRADVQTEITDRGTIIPAQTLAAPVVLDTGRHNIGTGRAAPIVMGDESSGVEIPQPGGGDYNYHSQTENMFVNYGDYVDCGDYANDIHFSAYGLSLNNSWWGGQIAAQRIRSSVGHIEIDGEIARSKVGQLFEGESASQSTVHSMVGGTTELVGDCLKADLGISFYSAKSRAYDKFNALFDETAFFANASFDACWFEEYGPGTVTFTESLGRVTALTFNAGAGGGVLDLGAAISPRFASCTFAGGVTVTGGYAPVFDSPLLVGGTLYVESDGHMRDVFFVRNATTTSDGQETVQQVGLTLPGYGENGTTQDHYGVSASHTSLAIAEIAGIGFATGMGHENLFTGDINDSGQWPVKTATLTSGQADPWGGTSATLFEGSAGQWVATGGIAAVDGEKCVMQAIMRAKVADTKISVRIDTQNGGVSPFRRICTYHFTDTRWRIVTLRVDVPSTATSFGFAFQYVDGDFDICQPQLSLGYDLPPILRPGQEVVGPFTQIDRRIIQEASAIPVSGNYWAGDEIVYPAATASTRKRRGAICTVGDGTSVGTWIETGIVADPGAAIADIGVAPTASDYNTVLARLRSAGIIAT